MFWISRDLWERKKKGNHKEGSCFQWPAVHESVRRTFSSSLKRPVALCQNISFPRIILGKIHSLMSNQLYQPLAANQCKIHPVCTPSAQGWRNKMLCNGLSWILLLGFCFPTLGTLPVPRGAAVPDVSLHYPQWITPGRTLYTHKLVQEWEAPKDPKKCCVLTGWFCF